MACTESELAEQIARLPCGGHLCLFYEREPAEQMPALLPFIEEALRRDEQFIYVADDQRVEELSSRLKHGGIQVERERQREALKLWTRQEWRQPGPLSSERKNYQVREFINRAAAAGFKGVRFAVEMTWTLGPEINAADLE